MIIKVIHLKALFIIAFITLTAISSISFTNRPYFSSDDLLGVYLSPNKRSKVKFVEKDGLYFGILIWNVNPELKDRYNPKPELRNKNLVGQVVFKSFKYNKYEHSWTGYFYDAESGTTYDCDLWLENAKRNLMARGYIETPIVGRTEVLKRIIEE